jgi:aspartate kinase
MFLQPTVVTKFGGWATQNRELFHKVATMCDDRRVECAVVSAPGAEEGGPKVTDLLIAAYGGSSEAWNAARIRFGRLCQNPDETDRMNDWLAAVESQLDRCTCDWLVSRGEWLTAQLLTLRTGLSFIDASDIIKFQLGADGTPELNIPATLRCIRTLCVYCVVPGFYGALPNGDIVLLDRGGSDTTAALVAKGLRTREGNPAVALHKMTDVPGLFSNDPNRDALAEHIPYITSEGLLGVSKTLVHPRAVQICQRAGVPIHIRSILTPAGRQTVVTDTSPT